MKKLPEKLHSQNGASILLALLFLLVCMMAAASVLTAAVSNAGKIRSNYEEQQRYLALSSALRLTAGELEQAKYYGRYDVGKWTEILTVKSIDAAGNEIVTTTEYPYYMVEQLSGIFTCGKLTPLKPDGTLDDAKAVLSFQKELDRVFSEKFSGVGYHGLKSSKTAPLPTGPGGASPTRILRVQVQGDAAVSEKFGPVTIDIDMSQTRRIHLTARLDAGTTADGNPIRYVMEAELAPQLVTPDPAGGTPQITAGGSLSIEYTPEDGYMPKDEPLKTAEETETGTLTLLVPPGVARETQTTGSYMTWKLDWITRESRKEADG
ncbi:hypothetical protein [Oscillibacter sp.]|uniref:hypothetical protein n=1 Tax=Oscillibacter sp. TaxID=1945593 RepID=UPI002D7F970D|nr:hypothetical protein [Oscillibacter sp.]